MSKERTRGEHLIRVLQCDECGSPREGCRDLACALQSRPYAGEDIVPASQLRALQAKLDEVTQERDRLREALAKIADGSYADATTAGGRRNFGPRALRSIAAKALSVSEGIPVQGEGTGA